jgi:hypothetical protein
MDQLTAARKLQDKAALARWLRTQGLTMGAFEKLQKTKPLEAQELLMKYLMHDLTEEQVGQMYTTEADKPFPASRVGKRLDRALAALDSGRQPTLDDMAWLCHQCTLDQYMQALGVSAVPVLFQRVLEPSSCCPLAVREMAALGLAELAMNKHACAAMVSDRLFVLPCTCVMLAQVGAGS